MKTIILGLLFAFSVNADTVLNFKLYPTPGATPERGCDKHTSAKLTVGDGIAYLELENKVSGGCEILVRPNKRSYKLVSNGLDTCGTEKYEQDADADEAVLLTDNRKRTCESRWVAFFIITEFDQNGNESKLYSLDSSIKEVRSTPTSPASAPVADANPTNRKNELVCKSKANASLYLVLTARTLVIGDGNDATLFDTTAVASGSDAQYGSIEGKAKYLTAEKNYNPRKYKDHVKFNLSHLVDTKDFGRFYPSDQCVVNVMIPRNAITLGSFSAPTVINCDQSGGSQTLECTYKEQN